MPISFDLISSLVILSLKLIKLFFILMVPCEGLSMSDKRFSNVDFPDPDGPIREYVFPFLNLKFKFLKH